MCGIAGFVDFKLTVSESETLIASMLQAIAHRGPDARGSYFCQGVMLGHNRLSIIDLSEHANQPMFYGDLSMVFNGELYNYLEIKDQLLDKGFEFSTASDSEVVMAAYAHWGEECVQHFVGMWAMVIHDKRKGQVFLSRDRFGVKPLYYVYKNGRFYFASEMKALKMVPEYTNTPNKEQISRGLQMGWLCYGGETYFEAVQELPAAHNLLLDLGPNGITETNLYRYWDIETGHYEGIPIGEQAELFREKFFDSVRLHMRSDVPVATCLSGGLDSSAIASVVQRLNPGSTYKSFTIYYDGTNEVDERPFVQEVLKQYPGIVPYFKSPSDDEVREAFGKAMYHAEVPVTGSSFLSQYFLMQLIASQGIKVVLDGQGSDEYLAGYMHTHYRAIADLIHARSWSAAHKHWRDVSANQGLSFSKSLGHFSKSLLMAAVPEQKSYQLEYKHYYPFLVKGIGSKAPFWLPQPPGSRTDAFLYNLMFNTSLPSLLQYEDRNSMAFAIESRVPFLDHRLVEFAFSLPVQSRIQGIETKKILRDALQGVLPEAVRTRRDKKGFVTPGEVKWLRGPLKHLTELDLEAMPFLDRKRVLSLFDAYRRGDNSKATLVWRIATLQYWMKNFV